MDLHEYDFVIINSSGGKDSLVAIFEVCMYAMAQGYDTRRITVSHQDLGAYEWPGTKELVRKQAEAFGLNLEISWRLNKKGERETLLEYVLRRGKWPSQNQRWCTSDFKRGPGARVVTRLTANAGKCKVLYVFGFRKDESPARSKRPVLSVNEKLTTKSRMVHEWLPVHDWSLKKVWEVIRKHGLPYHYAYDLGMPRLSCCFCIFSPFDALALAGIHNPTILEEYVQVEKITGHLFRPDFAIADVQKAINEGYQPAKIKTWTM